MTQVFAVGKRPHQLRRCLGAMDSLKRAVWHSGESIRRAPDAEGLLMFGDPGLNALADFLIAAARGV